MRAVPVIGPCIGVVETKSTVLISPMLGVDLFGQILVIYTYLINKLVQIHKICDTSKRLIIAPEKQLPKFP